LVRREIAGAISFSGNREKFLWKVLEDFLLFFFFRFLLNLLSCSLRDQVGLNEMDSRRLTQDGWDEDGIEK